MADERMDLNFGQEQSAQTSSYGGAAMQGEIFEDLAASAPTLTFDAEAEAQQALAAKAAQEAKRPDPEENILTPEELKMVEDFSKKIDITNSRAVMTYGVGTQKKMADFSEKTLESVKTKDMGEVGDMVTGLVTQLKNFDVDENEKGIKGFFKKKGNQMQEMKTKYTNVEKNVTAISNELEKHQVTLLKDVELLDRMYELNLNYYKELSMYILAGKKETMTREELELICEHCSDCEQEAAQAERESVKLFQTMWMEDKIGQVLPGHITGITDFGIFVQLDDSHCEGLVHMMTIEHPENYVLGDAVTVQVVRVDVNRAQIDFELV